MFGSVVEVFVNGMKLSKNEYSNTNILASMPMWLLLLFDVI